MLLEEDPGDLGLAHTRRSNQRDPVGSREGIVDFAQNCGAKNEIGRRRRRLVTPDLNSGTKVGNGQIGGKQVGSNGTKEWRENREESFRRLARLRELISDRRHALARVREKALDPTEQFPVRSDKGARRQDCLEGGSIQSLLA